MSISSTIGVIFSAVVSIGLPIFLFLFWRKRRKIGFLPMIVGSLAFVIVVLFFEAQTHKIVFSNFPIVTQNPALYVIYACFAAGIFEELGRFVAFKFLNQAQQINRVETALSYGIGHGGIEAILLTGVPMINLLVLGFTAKAQGTETLLSALPESSQAGVATQLNLLAGSNGLLFAISGIERILALTLHIMLSVLVWMVVTKKLPLPYLFLSIFLHALTNVGAALYQTESVRNIWIVEGYTAVIVLLTTIIVLALYRKKGKQLRMNLISK